MVMQNPKKFMEKKVQEFVKLKLFQINVWWPQFHIVWGDGVPKPHLFRIYLAQYKFDFGNFDEFFNKVYIIIHI